MTIDNFDDSEGSTAPNKRRQFTRIELVLLTTASLMFVGWTVALRAEGSVDSANRLAMSLISITRPESTSRDVGC